MKFMVFICKDGSPIVLNPNHIVEIKKLDNCHSTILMSSGNEHVVTRVSGTAMINPSDIFLPLHH